MCVCGGATSDWHLVDEVTPAVIHKQSSFNVTNIRWLRLHWNKQRYSRNRSKRASGSSCSDARCVECVVILWLSLNRLSLLVRQWENHNNNNNRSQWQNQADSNRQDAVHKQCTQSFCMTLCSVVQNESRCKQKRHSEQLCSPFYETSYWRLRRRRYVIYGVLLPLLPS